MKALTLQELFDVAAKNAAKIFNENDDHEVLPMWHAVSGKGENVLIATPWSNNEEKDAAMDGLRLIFQEHRVKRYAFITEAWVRAVRDPSEIDGRVSQHPDRREVVMVQAEDRDGSQIMGYYYILRPEHGPPKLSPFEVMSYDGIAGRMVGLLS